MHTVDRVAESKKNDNNVEHSSLHVVSHVNGV